MDVGRCLIFLYPSRYKNQTGEIDEIIRACFRVTNKTRRMSAKFEETAKTDCKIQLLTVLSSTNWFHNFYEEPNE
jgi:hypothetical protein